MGFEPVLGICLVVVLLVYLGYALTRPEKF
jgi:K+-transporting ATPase KdpF subunit